MLKVIFTLDYEIHGNGEGCPKELMVEPTERMLRQFDQHGAKLTILADVAEILKFKEYAQRHGRDDYHYQSIADQLRSAIRAGHDVQLHLHSSYFNAQHAEGKWRQDWSEYNFAGLSPQRLNELVRMGKEFLEALLRPVDSSYRCYVFRAANWSVSPSQHVVRALVENNIEIDTSVFKYGRRQGLVTFDYEQAHSALEPWRASEQDICRPDPRSPLLEIPIYAERRWVGAFVTPQRIYRALMTRRHRVLRVNGNGAAPGNGNGKSPARLAKWLSQGHAWKADFNQCSGRQLIAALRRAEKEFGAEGKTLPFVLIGHSKSYNRFNERSLEPFLKFVAQGDKRFGFGTFAAFRNGCAEPAECAVLAS